METVIEVQEKPILFTGSMIRALQEGKSQTRRLAGLDEVNYQLNEREIALEYISGDQAVFSNGFGNLEIKATCPYGEAGTRLWVRETFASLCRAGDPYCHCDGDEKKENHFYQYKADTYHVFRGEGKYDRYPGNWDDALTEPGQTHHPREADYVPRWKPSIFMPREACRYLLNNKGIGCERLQRITVNEIKAEGVDFVPGWDTPDVMFAKWIELWNSINMKPKKRKANRVAGQEHYVSYPWSMDDFIQAYGDKVRLVAGQMVYRDRWLYVIPNPFVWVVDFQISEVRHG